MSLNLNLKEFLKYLLRFKWVLLIVPIIFASVTYLLVKKMPKKYVSSALISTGITNQFQQNVINGGQVDYLKLSEQFDNMLQIMKSRKNLTALSYKLILHDLKNSQHAFKKPTELITSLTPEDREIVINEYQKRLDAGTLISVKDNGSRIKLYDILVSAGYSESDLADNISITRNGESDFIKIEYTSPNPDLSAFVVNTFARDFITYYTNLSVSGQKETLDILDSLLRKKRLEMEEKNAAAQNSITAAASQAAGAANSQRQSELAYSKSAEAEAQRQFYIRQISSIKGTIADIDAKLRGQGGYVNTEPPVDNSAIIDIDAKLRVATQRYYNNNLRPQDKASIDSLQRIKEGLMARVSAGSGNLNQTAIKQDLLTQKLKLESDLAAAQSALATVERQIATLPKIGTTVAASQGPAQNIIREAEIAAADYQNMLNQYNQTKLIAETSATLTLAEPGLPGEPEKSKNMLYVGASGISGFLVCTLALFVTFALNTSVSNKVRLEAITQQKVLGYLNYVEGEDKDLRNIWNDNGSNNNYSIYKELLRSLRFEINQALTPEENVLGITSITYNEGKTFLAGSLSYAFAMMGKNVLLICEKDGNILDLVTNKKNAPSSQKFESFLVKKQIQVEDRITILNRNTSGSNSLLELRDTKSLIAGFEVLKKTFDIVIIDIDSSKDMHNVKEWMMFCDKSIAVYAAGNKFKEENATFINYLSQQPGFLGWVLNKVKAV